MATIFWDCCSCGKHLRKYDEWSGLDVPCSFCRNWQRVPVGAAGEIWEQLSSFKKWMYEPGLTRRYYASNLGRVRSHYLTNGGLRCKLIGGSVDRDSGYHNGSLAGVGIKQPFHVHELIWWAFNGPIPSAQGFVIGHKDERRDSKGGKCNALANLYLTDHSGNGRDAAAHGLLPSRERHHNFGRRFGAAIY
jgi:hypothetical protein